MLLKTGSVTLKTDKNCQITARADVKRHKEHVNKRLKMLLSKALTCMNFFLYKQKWLFYHGDGYLWLYCCMDNLYISHRSLYAPQHIAFKHSAACLSVVFELLPGFIPFTILWHIGRILNKNVTMNKNYSYPTTLWVSILTQIYVFMYCLQFLLLTLKHL